MRRRKDDCTPPSASSPAAPGNPGGPTAPPNAFTDELFAALDERDLEPAVPEGHLPGPWRVTRLWGDGPPLWAVYGLGVHGPRFSFCDPASADLAHLAAAALAVAERPRRFRFQAGADGRLHLMHDGAAVACVHTPELEHTSLASDLTRFADLRAQPLALAQLLAATPSAVLRRPGAIVLDALAGSGPGRR
jgi:hypothetical protein